MISHQSISLLLASLCSVLPAGENTLTHVGGRKTCCQAQHSQTTGAATLRHAAVPATPTSSADQTSCRALYDWGARHDLSQERHAVQPCSSVDSEFRSSRRSLRSENSERQREPGGRTRRRARPHASPTLVS